jgi:hypothetical protein
MRNLIRSLAALLSVLAVSPSLAQVPNFPQTLPANSVVGRLGIGPGPAQAIPFAALKTVLGGVFGPGTSTVVGNLVLWNNITGTVLSDAGGPITAFGLSMAGAANAAAAWGVLGTIPCAQTSILTGGDVAKSAGSCLASVNFTSPSTGGVSRTLRSKLAEGISVTDFGAVCNGSTDDTAAITLAITAAANSRLTLPPGVNCKVIGSGTAIFAITTPIIIDCQGSSITLDATVPNTRNLFSFKPPSAGDRLPKRRLTRCLLDMNGVGAATIVIDTTASNTIEIGEFEIDHVRDTASGTTTGTNASIFVNNIGTNTNGGTFNVNFHDNVLLNGIYLNSAGDSIRVQDNILSGAKYGVYASLISGAAGLIITGNNISAADPLLIDASIGNIAVTNNEFEQQVTTTDPGTAVVDFRGGVGALTHVTFTGNSVIALAATGSPAPLKISNVTQAYVESNTFQTSASVVCIVNAGSGTIIGASNTFVGCSANVSNSGTLKYVQVGVSP